MLRVPFYHRNIDYDEVIFYHRGEFFSRAGITEGMLTFHPAGIKTLADGRKIRICKRCGEAIDKG